LLESQSTHNNNTLLFATATFVVIVGTIQK